MSLTKANSSKDAIKHFLESVSQSELKKGGVYRVIFEKDGKPMVQSFNLIQGGKMTFNVEEYKTEELFTDVKTGGSIWPTMINGNMALVRYPPVTQVYSDFRWIPGYGLYNFAIQSASTVKVDMISKISKKVVIKATSVGKSDSEIKTAILNQLKKKFSDANKLTNFQVHDISIITNSSGQKELTSINISYQKTTLGTYPRYKNNDSQGELFENVLSRIDDFDLV